MREVRIVGRRRGIGPQILHLVPERPQHRNEALLHLEPGVIAGNGDFRCCHVHPRRESVSEQGGRGRRGCRGDRGNFTWITSTPSTTSTPYLLGHCGHVFTSEPTACTRRSASRSAA